MKSRLSLIGIIIIIIMFVAIAIIIPMYYYLLLSFHRPTLPTPTTMAGIDKFDIRKIYPTKPGGEQWYFNIDDPNNDPRTGEGGGPSTTFVQKNDDGSWKVQSTEVRYGVLTSSGYHPELITTLNQHDLAAKGYMQSPNDWKNLEMTGYFKVNSFTDSTQNGAAHIELVARGGRNTNDLTKINGLPEQCEATTYHSNTYVTGRVKFEKDLQHTVGYTNGDPEKLLTLTASSLQGRWIGIKAVFYNLPDGSVKLEQWVDDGTSDNSNNNNNNPSGNNWHRVLTFVDDGNWGGGHPDCGGTDHAIITWGGPIAIFRWDNIDDMDVRGLSVREIQPPS